MYLKLYANINIIIVEHKKLHFLKSFARRAIAPRAM